MSESTLLKIWKQNVTECKWIYVKNLHPEFLPEKIERNVNTLESFFDFRDLNPKINGHIHDVDFSENWLHFILIQKHLGTIFLVFELCKVIDYFNERDLNYIRHKLLKKDGRILKDFRNKYFEVFFNYNIEKAGILVNIKKCYRNKYNPKDEGHDSYFKFLGKEYVVECLKVKSQFEIQTRAVYKLTQVLYKSLKKFQSKLKKLPIIIFAQLSDNIKNIEFEFNETFKKALNLFYDNNIILFEHSSQIFEKLIILFEERQIQEVKDRFGFDKYSLELKIELKDFEYLDSNKRNVGIKITDDVMEYRKYRISSKFTYQKSNRDFEQFLIGKIRNKTKQLKLQEPANKIIAVELESYSGFGRFQYDFNYSFPEVFKKSSKNLIIILQFKDSSGDNINLERKIFHTKNDKLVRFLSSGLIGSKN